MSRRFLDRMAVLAALGFLALACGQGREQQGEGALAPQTSGQGSAVAELMRARGLSEADVTAALKTYLPTGKKDNYYIFSSGGQSGQVIVIGIPSMRILKYIAVFTPESWQGFGFGDKASEGLFEEGRRRGFDMRWGDTHHPNLSETDGDYDGQFLFIGDKANARLAVINLADFITTQVIANPLLESDHGAAFVTPNTEYVIESSQYPVPLGGAFAPLEEYNEKYRGAATFWKFDRAAGRIVPEQSFAVELPPYMQDLSDAGKLVSDGWAFINSFNTERSIGGNMEGRPPLESGASQNDMDYLHVVNWKKAEELFKAGKTRQIAGFPVIPLEVAAAEGVLAFVPEPKSPHGCDVTPDGRFIVVGGKLDTHATVFSFEKIKALMEAKDYAGTDPYGVPILDFQKSIHGQVELGLGPLHTVYDDVGNAYTSMFVESKIAKWSLADMKLVEKLPVHYNIGHIAAAHGDTVKPHGKWVVAMNKWAIDRFADVGPLLPQNFQLVDVSGPSMQLVYDLPIPLGEPHYTQIIAADRIKAIDHYTPVGFDAVKRVKDEFAVAGGEERIERRDDGVHVYMTQVRSHFTPDTIRVKQGETVHLHITNVEQAKDATHGFGISSYNISLSIEPGEHNNVTFKADRAGVFPFYCLEFCSALHLEMAGYLVVEPAACILAALACAGPDPAAESARPAASFTSPPRPDGCRELAGGDLQAAVDAAADGSALCLAPGSFAGPIRLARGIALWGPPEAVIRSAGEGTTVRLEGEGPALLGVTIDGSGGRFDLLDAAVHVAGRGARVEGVRVRNATFGILVERAAGVRVRGNDVAGAPELPFGLRGDAIRLWEVQDSVVEANRVRDGRDVVLWYATGNRLVSNRIEGGRYGAHLMYSHRTEIAGNEFVGNVTGVFVMYSRDATIRGNLFADSAGAAGIGLGLKESGNLRVEENLLVHNTVGLYVDTSPLWPDDRNLFAGNVFRLNQVGIAFLGRADQNELRGNGFRDNQVQVEVDGRGDARAASWLGNEFDDYAGYDLDGDGTGDLPYELRSLTSDLIAEAPALAFFRGTPALGLAGAIGALVPILAPQLVLVDRSPRMSRVVWAGPRAD